MAHTTASRMPAIFIDHGSPYDWAQSFNEAVHDSLLRGEDAQLIDYQQWGQDALLSVPTPEHFLPLLYIAGTRQDDETITVPIDGIEMGSISMLIASVGHELTR